MKELKLQTLLAVFEEMFGTGLFWAMVGVAAIALLAILFVMIRDRGLLARRLVRAELLAPVGGVAAVAFVLAMTNSRPGDVGGPIDWLAVLGVFVAGAGGAVVLTYLFCAAFLGKREA
jgi:hypothetical protein